MPSAALNEGFYREDESGKKRYYADCVRRAE